MGGRPASADYVLNRAPSDLHVAWAAAFRRLWVFRMIGMQRWHAHRSFWTGLRCVVLAAVWAAVPLLVDAVSVPFGVEVTDPNHVVLLYAASLFVFLTLVWGGFGWSTSTVGSELDSLSRDALVAPLSARLVAMLTAVYRGQVWGVVIGAAVLSIPRLFSGDWRFAPAEVVSFAIASVVVGTGVYLAFTMSELPLVIARAEPDEVTLLRLDPAATPGLASIAIAIRVGSTFLLFAIVFMAGMVVAMQIARIHLSPLTVWTVVVATLLGIGVLCRFSVTMVLSLREIIGRARGAVITQLDDEIARLQRGPHLPWTSGRVIALVDQLRTVSHSESLPFKTSSIVQLGAAGAGAVLTVALPFIVSFVQTRG